ncbi:MAG: SIR2 family protein [Phycisphaerales bacterium]|nr:SIR2 family protein [Phycisphaerales bacterium]
MPTNDEPPHQHSRLSKHYAKLDDATPFYESGDAPAMDAESVLKARRAIEPWLCSLFQAEHLALLVGTGLPIALGHVANIASATMSSAPFSGALSTAIETEAQASAKDAGRGDEPNIEDRLRAAIALYEGLRIAVDDRAGALLTEIERQIVALLKSVLKGEEDFVARMRAEADGAAADLIASFLLSFASRAGTRDRLQLFTTNYDRFIEYGCDRAGIRIIDRFVGMVEPVFRASRLNIDMHYNPPGIRGEPRYLEGVIRLTKLHGSLDWRADGSIIRRCMLPFGAKANHTEIPTVQTLVNAASGQPASPGNVEPPNSPFSVLVYPNPAKDIETLSYPYAELFRDFAAAVCRPNTVLVTFGYGFGDDHINRIIRDALTIPSTHLVIISYDDPGGRVSRFRARVGSDAQLTILLGSHFGDLSTLVRHYLPKPALDSARARKTGLLQRRGEPQAPPPTHPTQSDDAEAGESAGELA